MQNLHFLFMNDSSPIYWECDLSSVDAVPNLNVILSFEHLLVGPCIRSYDSCLPILTFTDIIVNSGVKRPLVALFRPIYDMLPLKSSQSYHGIRRPTLVTA